MVPPPFIQPGAFEPDAIAAMSEALEAALKELQDTGQPRPAREVVARRLQPQDLVSAIRFACAKPRSANQTVSRSGGS